jgi:hypothetical protein
MSLLLGRAVDWMDALPSSGKRRTIIHLGPIKAHIVRWSKLARDRNIQLEN